MVNVLKEIFDLFKTYPSLILSFGILGILSFIITSRVTRKYKIIRLYNELNNECKLEQVRLYSQFALGEMSELEFVDKSIWLGQLYEAIFFDAREMYLNTKRTKVNSK